MGPQIDRAFRVLASDRSTAFLVLCLSASALVAVLVPQGKEALELARSESAVRLQTLASYGLCAIFDSPWILAVAVLLTSNLAAFFLCLSRTASSSEALAHPPARAPLSRSLLAAYPERSVEIVRDLLVYRVGQPHAEHTEGSRVSMVFDSGKLAKAAPQMTHLGLALVVLSAGLYASEETDRQQLARGIFMVTDTRSDITSRFDIVAEEGWQFFQWKSKYILRGYTSDKDGLGPAARFERIAEGEGRGPEFWVYQHAPEGFDRRHRQGEVAIRVASMGMAPAPGSGLADSKFAALMLLGAGMIGFGATLSQRPRGRLWVVSDGDKVDLFGLPQVAGDPHFSQRFEQLSSLISEAVAEEV